MPRRQRTVWSRLLSWENIPSQTTGRFPDSLKKSMYLFFKAGEERLEEGVFDQINASLARAGLRILHA